MFKTEPSDFDKFYDEWLSSLIKSWSAKNDELILNDMSIPVNGSTYRALINNEPISNERSVSFEPDEVHITVLTNEDTYQYWLKRKGERVNFKLTNTSIDLTLIIFTVISNIKLESVVEVVIKLTSDEWLKQRKEMGL